MNDLNIRALTELTLRFLPAVIAGRGRIMNVASVAGFLPGPGMAVYYASKAYVVSFSQALSQELEGSGVTVTALCARAGLDASLLKNMPSMSSMVVAQAGYDGLMKGRRLVVPGLFNRLTTRLLPFMPNGLLLPVMARIQERRKGK
jgi:short-subunit dehydrogenase